MIDNKFRNNKFDTAAFERHKKDRDDNMYARYTDILPNDTLIEYFKDKTPGYIKYFTVKRPKNSYLSYESVYYENGNIKSERTYGTDNGLATGISRYYSIEGELEREINEDEGYSFTFDQLMNLLNERGIRSSKNANSDYSYRIYRIIAEDGSKAYYVNYPLSDGTDLAITVSGKDGSILDEHRYSYKEH